MQSEQPMKKRATVKLEKSVTRAMQKTAGVVMSMVAAVP